MITVSFKLASSPEKWLTHLRLPKQWQLVKYDGAALTVEFLTPRDSHYAAYSMLLDHAANEDSLWLVAGERLASLFEPGTYKIHELAINYYRGGV